MTAGDRPQSCRWFVVVLVLVCGRAAAAQITSATISGTVKDQTGAVLPGVDVAVKNLDTGLSRAAVTERHQFGFTSGRPLRRNRSFFFAGAEWLVEDLGLTQLTEVPSIAARAGALGPIPNVVRPYLALFSLPNGPDLGDGLARFTFPFNRPTREMFAQARIDHNVSNASALRSRIRARSG